MRYGLQCFPDTLALRDTNFEVSDENAAGPGVEEIEKYNQHYSILKSESRKELTVNVEVVIQSSSEMGLGCFKVIGEISSK